MTIPPPAAYATTLQLMLVPIALWCVLASLERIAVRRAFRPGQPLGTDLAALVRGRMTSAILASPLCAPPALLIVPALRLAAGLALPFANGAGTAALLVAILGGTALLSFVKRGNDGADKVVSVACVAALLITAGRLIDDRWLCLAGLLWGAGQVTILYVTSGVAKLARGFWRDGSALAAAMTSYRSGHAVAAAVVRHRPAALTLAWAVMLLESLFPLALLAPPAVCLAVLAALAAFHVATALVMGLNTYPFAFLATYPCIMMANAIIVGTPATGVG